MKLNDVIQRLSSDPAVWGTVRNELSSARDRKARFIELARERGMTVDAGDLERLVAAGTEELSDNDLDSVSGGFNPQPDPPKIASSRQELVNMLSPGAIFGVENPTTLTGRS